jgi:hypothetical protein
MRTIFNASHIYTIQLNTYIIALPIPSYVLTRHNIYKKRGLNREFSSIRLYPLYYYPHIAVQAPLSPSIRTPPPALQQHLLRHLFHPHIRRHASRSMAVKVTRLFRNRRPKLSLHMLPKRNDLHTSWGSLD